MAEHHEDSWESVGWEAEEAPDRDEVLRLARQLAERRERHRADDLAELDELKQTLRERVADVAAREEEVERRRMELAAEDSLARSERPRFRRRRQDPLKPQSESVAADSEQVDGGEVPALREAEAARRAQELEQREQQLARAEAELRRLEQQLDAQNRGLVDRAGDLDRRAEELEDRERQLRKQESDLAHEHTDLGRQADDIAARVNELDTREAELENQALALAAERERIVADARSQDREQRDRGELDRLRESVRAGEAQLAGLRRELQEAREKNAATEQRGRLGSETLQRLEADLHDRERRLTVREAELTRMQVALAARQEELQRRERALEDAERLKDRVTAEPQDERVGFREGLDSLAGGARGRWAGGTFQ